MQGGSKVSSGGMTDAAVELVSGEMSSLSEGVPESNGVTEPLTASPVRCLIEDIVH